MPTPVYCVDLRGACYSFANKKKLVKVIEQHVNHAVSASLQKGDTTLWYDIIVTLKRRTYKKKVKARKLVGFDTAAYDRAVRNKILPRVK